MKRITSYILLTILLAGTLCAQENYPVHNDVLTGLFSSLAESSSDNERQSINDSIRKFAHQYAATDSVFRFTYDARYLGQVTSSDSLVKIITWNLLLESGKNRYFCYIVRKGNNGSGNKIYELSGEHSDKPVLTDTTYSISDWYGALYYDIHPFSDSRNAGWVVLGLDYGSSDVSRKVIDVIGFSGDKPPLFGRKIFQTGSGVKYRQVFEYASLGSMSLRFSSDSTIVFDHLVPISKSKESGKQLMGPDFSYDAFVLRHGKWNLMLDIDARNKE